jgi:hypothetical protein
VSGPACARTAASSAGRSYVRQQNTNSTAASRPASAADAASVPALVGSAATLSPVPNQRSAVVRPAMSCTAEEAEVCMTFCSADPVST